MALGAGRSRPLSRFALVALLALLGCAAFAIAATGARADATIVANDSADFKLETPGCEPAPTGIPCTLREALQLVNEGGVSGEVTIEIQVEGTIGLEEGELQLDPPAAVEGVSIVGPGTDRLTIDGSEASRVLAVEGAGKTKVSGLTIKDGFDGGSDGGGGIHSKATALTLEGVQLLGNEAAGNGGGIAIESGELSLENSVISHNHASRGGGVWLGPSAGKASLEGVQIESNFALEDGGGIAAEGQFALLGSTVSDNDAYFYGGGVYSTEDSVIERSTVAGNNISDSPGALPSEEGGGGIAAAGGEVIRVYSSTVANNRGGGIFALYGEALVRNSTIAGNSSASEGAVEGAGVEGEEGFEIESSIVAGNTAGGVPADCAGRIGSLGHNVLGFEPPDPESLPTNPEHPPLGCDWKGGAGDQIGVDPGLGALADNGGPTLTMAPVSAASPAINAGSHEEASDQRGRPRPVASMDVGAVEVQAPLLETAVTIGSPGPVEQGRTLTCQAGEWDTDTVTDPSYSYAWFADGTQVDSGAEHQVTSADGGKELTCAVSVGDGAATTTKASLVGVEVAAAEATIEPASFDFGEVRLGQTTPAQAFHVVNAGGVDLEVDEVTGGGSEFELAGDSCEAQALAPGDECDFEVTFSPAASGLRSASFTAVTDGGEPTATVEGTGTAPLIQVAPTSLSFGRALVGSGPSTSQYVTISNAGNASLHLGALAVAGADTSSFSILAGSDGCSNASLEPGEECEVQVVFSPQAAGPLNAVLAVPGDAPTATVALDGTGTEAVFSVSPASFDFGEQLVGTSSDPEDFVVTNTGSAVLETEEVELQGAGAGEFGIESDGCSFEVLSPGDECIVAVAFEPTAVGAQTATLHFAGAKPGSVALEGTATGAAEIHAEPSILQFGNVSIGAGPATQTVTVTDSGTAALHLGTVVIGAATQPTFSIVAGADECSGATLEPSDECTIEVAFEPVTQGVSVATLEVPGDAPTAAVVLQGTGIEPRFSVTPEALDLGEVTVGEKSQSHELTVENHGNDSMTVGEVEITGAAADQFALGGEDTCSDASLAPGAECTVTVLFAPTAAGYVEATLSFPGTAPGSAELAGTGLAAPPAPPSPTPSTPAAPAPSPIPPEPAPATVVLKQRGAKLAVTAKGPAKLRLACQSPAGTPCAASLKLLRAGKGSGLPKKLGHWSGSLAAGATKTVKVNLAKAARTALAAGKPLRVVVVLSGPSGQTRTKLTLKPAPAG